MAIYSIPNEYCLDITTRFGKDTYHRITHESCSVVLTILSRQGDAKVTDGVRVRTNAIPTTDCSHCANRKG